MIILDMLNILRSHGISPSAIPPNVSLLKPNHQIVREISKLRAKLSSNRYKQARVLYKKVIKPINIAFIRSLYAMQNYNSIHNYNPVLDFDYLFGQYENNNIENPALYRLLKEHRSQRNLIKFIILTHFCNKPDVITDEMFDDLIKKLQELQAKTKDDKENTDICRILEGLSAKRTDFYKLGLAKAMIGGAAADLSLDVIVVYCGLALQKHTDILNDCKKLIEGIHKNDPIIATRIIERMEKVNNNSDINVKVKPLLTASVINPIEDNFAVEQENMVELLKSLDTTTYLEEIKEVYFKKIIGTPKTDNLENIVRTITFVKDTITSSGKSIVSFTSYTPKLTGKFKEEEKINASTWEKDEAAEIAKTKLALSSGLAMASPPVSSGKSLGAMIKAKKSTPPWDVDTEYSEICTFSEEIDISNWLDAHDTKIYPVSSLLPDKLTQFTRVTELLKAFKFINSIITDPLKPYEKEWLNNTYNSTLLMKFGSATNIKDAGGTDKTIKLLKSKFDPLIDLILKNIFENIIKHYETNGFNKLLGDLEKISQEKDATRLGDTLLPAFTTTKFATSFPKIAFTGSFDPELKDISDFIIEKTDSFYQKAREKIVKIVRKMTTQFDTPGVAYQKIDLTPYDEVFTLISTAEIFKNKFNEYKGIIIGYDLDNNFKIIIEAKITAASLLPSIEIKKIIEDTKTNDLIAVLNDIKPASTGGVYTYKGESVFINKVVMSSNMLDDIKGIFQNYIDKKDTSISLKTVDNTDISFMGFRFVIATDKSTSIKSVKDLYDSIPNLEFSLSLGLKMKLYKLLDLLKKSELFKKSVDDKIASTTNIFMDSNGVCFQTKGYVFDIFFTYLYYDDAKSYYEFGLINYSSKKRIYYICKKQIDSTKFNLIADEMKEVHMNTTSMTGGAFYKKYLKYKSKYLQIK